MDGEASFGGKEQTDAARVDLPHSSPAANEFLGEFGKELPSYKNTAISESIEEF